MAAAAVGASELRAELRLRDGQRRAVSVQVQDNLSSLICGLGELNQAASRLLSELVEQERNPGGGVQGEEEDKDEDGDEDEEEEEEQSNGILNSAVQPPAKRPRT